MIGTTAKPPEAPKPPFSFAPVGFPNHRVVVVPYTGITTTKGLFTNIDGKLLGAEIGATDAGEAVWIFLVELHTPEIAKEEPIPSVFDYREMMKTKG